MKYALALLATLAARAQERLVVDRREFILNMPVQERAIEPTLWVSREGGKTWKSAREAGVEATWYEWSAGAIRCRIRAPEDGPWDFYAQLSDTVGNRNPAPKADDPPHPAMRYMVRTQGRLTWTSPRPGEDLIGGNQVLFRWTSDKKGLRAGSVHIYFRLETHPWRAVASDLDLEGEHLWILPLPPAETKIRFRLAAFATDGQEVTAPDLETSIGRGAAVAGLSWDSPKGGSLWMGGATVTLKWTSMGPEVRERTAELQYSIEDEPWTPIAKGLEPTGSHLWVVPNRETARLRLRVRALTRAGQEESATTDPVAIRLTARPNVGHARALYDRARVLAAQQRYAEAQLKYEEALAAWSDFGEVLNDLGTVHAEQKEPAKALEYFLQARKTCPSNPVAYVNASMMKLRMGLHEDALAELQDAVALGLEKHDRAAVLAAETLWVIAAAATVGESWDRAQRACALILKIRQAPPPTRSKAERHLQKMKTRP